MASLDVIVYLCRHGRTHLNAQGRVRGQEDPPLDEVGRAEAAALGFHFATVELDSVAATPLQRAHDTAQAIADPHRLAVRAAPELMDRDYGPWAGQPTAEVLARFGTIDAAPGVEPWDEFGVRVLAGFHAVLDTSPPGPAVIVAHDAVNRALMAQLVGLDPAHIPQATGCWNALEVDDGTWTVVALDQRPDPAPT